MSSGVDNHGQQINVTALIAEFHAHFEAFVRPTELMLNQPVPDPLLVPLHLATIQEGFDLIAPFSTLLPEDTYAQAVRQLLRLRSQLESLERNIPGQARQVWSLSSKGQWVLNIDSDVLAELCELRVSDTRIAALFGCSASTIKRRRQEAGLQKQRSEMTLDELCASIERVREMGTGEAGERCLTGALSAVGISVSRAMIRAAVRTLDPFPVSPRWQTALQRRTYFVPFVNSLWHLDGHHKLIRWRIVIHGCIDGKTRVVTYMKANSDNTAASVRTAFLEAVDKWGLPSRVRADFGGENLGVKEVMEERRGQYRS
ncbi:hypothetical protein CF336_g9557 [Tilletia laevis]|uniref:Integrase catalytic domain-containing protein n=1 Tax=Tilletia caries TaxID=13290 RepID=A0A8T8SBC3_9BASI|nr:hypothetical protein CF336_g9557 [Tilletia laevis]KAE8179720.1 hypothetical protein CF335_g9495 [Tilletia laevis]KAE8236363.1 hypothetical protein A4X03_0g9465 [Tilletia caries]